MTRLQRQRPCQDQRSCCAVKCLGSPLSASRPWTAKYMMAQPGRFNLHSKRVNSLHRLPDQIVAGSGAERCMHRNILPHIKSVTSPPCPVVTDLGSGMQRRQHEWRSSARPRQADHEQISHGYLQFVVGVWLGRPAFRSRIARSNRRCHARIGGGIRARQRAFLQRFVWRIACWNATLRVKKVPPRQLPENARVQRLAQALLRNWSNEQPRPHHNLSSYCAQRMRAALGDAATHIARTAAV
jgi:hypothetical protein